MSPQEKTSLVKTLGARIGFDRVGVVSAGPLKRRGYYRDWLARGHAGDMAYLGRNADLREEPARLMPGARSIVCAAVSYKRDDADDTPAVSEAQSAPMGRVARYARGRDYHIVIRRLLDELIAGLRESLPEDFDARAFVDTGPLIERELAAAAGIGWIGKNTLVMHETLGSYLFLGEIVTTLELAADEPATDHCGTCTRCLDSCPTQAFQAPYQMDASRCISYLTIEHRGAVPGDLATQLDDWVYGCDVCQEVCPHNAKAPISRQPELAENRIPARLTLDPLVTLTSGGYKRLTAGTAAGRASRAMWQRNAALAANSLERGGRTG